MSTRAKRQSRQRHRKAHRSEMLYLCLIVYIREAKCRSPTAGIFILNASALQQHRCIFTVLQRRQQDYPRQRLHWVQSRRCFAGSQPNSIR